MKHVVFAVALVAIITVPAMGDWSDDFQSYPLGPIDGKGGWAGWDGGPVNAAVTGAPAPKFTGDQAVRMSTNDDLVQQFIRRDSGQWTFSAMQYIPSAHQGSVTFLIMMNNYTPSLKGWSVQMKFDYATGLVTDDESSEKPGVPIVYDAWAEIKVLIDLDANTQSTYYNGASVGSADWYDPMDVNHDKSIAALDLWADSGGDGVCYDDISLVLVPEPAAASLCLLALGGLLLRRR